MGDLDGDPKSWDMEHLDCGPWEGGINFNFISFYLMVLFYIYFMCDMMVVLNLDDAQRYMIGLI